MSENLTRKNSLRRSIAAVIGAVSLACGSVAVPVVAPEFAQAARAADIEKNWDPVDVPFEPKVELGVDKQNPTGDFSYILSFDAQPPRPPTDPAQNGQSNLLDFEIWINTKGGNTELARDPLPADIEWASGITREFPRGVEPLPDGRKVIYFGEIPDGDYPIRATFPARVAGSEVPRSAEAGTFARLNPKVGWAKLEDWLFELPQDEPARGDLPGSMTFFHVFEDPETETFDRCLTENVAFYKLDGGGYGQQLADLYLGVDQPWLRADSSELDDRRVNELKQMGYWIHGGTLIKITDPDGTNITDAVMEKATVAENPQAPAEYNESATANWQKAFNWPTNTVGEQGGIIDSSEVWLRSGTMFEIHQLQRITPDERGCHLRDSEGTEPNGLSYIRAGRGPVEAGWRTQLKFGSPFIGDRVWVDTNGDGIQNEDETTGVPNVKVIVSREGEPDRTATTDADGKWLVQDLTPGAQYNVRFVLPADGDYKDYVVTQTGAGDVDADSNGLSFTTNPVPAAGDLTYDLGITPPKPASVGDRVWVDANRNGVQDEGETNVAGVTVTVTGNGETHTATTDSNGKWRVDGLTPGVEYTVAFELPEGYKTTDALVGEDRGVDSNGLRSTVTLTPGEYNETYDLGVFQPASVGDFVWEDTNGNGIQDEGEPPVPNTTVRVTGPNGETHTTVTDNEGKWSVTGLTPGVEYTVEFTPPAGYQVTKPEQGEDRGKDSNPQSSKVTLDPGENNTSYDLGLVKSASVGDRVWLDSNDNGVQDEGEANVAGVTVTVTGNGDTHTATTDSNGKWRVDGLTPGEEYTVAFTPPAGYEVTKTGQGDEATDSNPLSSTVILTPGEYNETYDLGLVGKPASVGDRVWIDANRNGVQDEGEENLAGVTVTVTPPAGSDEQPRTVTTDADGKWHIDELTPGVEYTVTFELPEGYKATDALVGDDRGVDSNGLRSTVTLQPEEYNDTYDLGVFQPASIGDFVWEDTNGNGIQDEGEPAVPNTIVRVTGPNGETHTTATDKDGKWSVDGLTPGVEYTVEFTPPAGYQVTKTEQGEDRGKDSNPLSSTVSLKPGENNTTYDLGLVKPASIGDRVWVDENENGIQDENEKNGVPNARVTVTASEGVDEQPRTTTTDDKGNWRIDGLTPGVEYTVTFELPEGVSATKSLVGDDRGVDSNELSTKITLESDQHDPTFDLGVVPASIGDRVWLDEGDEEKVGRADGIQDDGEGGIADVVVRVSRPGEEVRETKTGADGTWKIEGLTPGVDDYRVEFDAPDGYRISPTKAGDDAAVDSNGLSDKVAALKSGEFNDTYDLGLFIDVPVTTTVTTPVPTVETTKVSPTPCDCSPTTVPTTVTSKVPVPTTTTQVMSTTKTQPVPTTLTTQIPVPTTTTQAVPTTLTTQVPVPTTTTQVVSTTKTQSVPTTLTTEVPVPTTVPTTTTQAVPTTVTKAVPTTVEKAVPTTVHSTTTAEAPKRGTIGDRVWVDENGDGKEDPEEKTGVPGVTVIVKDPEGKEVTRTVTDENGNWKVDVEPGEYTVRYEPGDRTPSDKELVERTITIKPGENRDDIDLGILPSGSVGDHVWNDEDGDGKQGDDEKGLENVVVLVSREGEPTRSAVTDENGDWKIEGLNSEAEYEVRFIKPEGWEVTGKVPGSDESGLVSKVTVKPNEYNDTYDLGLQKLDPDCDCEPVKPGTIGNRVWIDLNGNGKQDPNETEGVPDVTVIVRDKDGNEVTRTVTDEDGNWKVNVEPGDYEIEYRPRDWKPTDPKRVTQKVTVEEGKEYLDLDLGVQKPKPGEPTPPTDGPAPDPEKGSSTETLDRCVANAVRSPLLYLVPVALLGAFGGEIARPYMGAINEQVNQINAQFQEAMRRNSPDWGRGGRGGRDNDQFAELRGQIDAANRRIAELGQDPNVQRFGTVAAGIIGLIAAGGVLYDWCSNEKGEAFTSIGGSSAKESDAEGRQSSSKDAA